MYAKIENGAVVEYPLNEGDLEIRFPDIPFPLDSNNQPVPEGYVRVKSVPLPEFSATQYYMPGPPVLIDGEWVQTYDAVPYTPEQLESRREATESAMRAKRNSLLAATDWTQLADSPESLRQAYVTYRQELRDVPQQSDFPWTIQWPTAPATA